MSYNQVFVKHQMETQAVIKHMVNPTAVDYEGYHLIDIRMPSHTREEYSGEVFLALEPH